MYFFFYVLMYFQFYWYFGCNNFIKNYILILLYHYITNYCLSAEFILQLKDAKKFFYIKRAHFIVQYFKKSISKVISRTGYRISELWKIFLWLVSSWNFRRLIYVGETTSSKLVSRCTYYTQGHTSCPYYVRFKGDF